MFRSGEFHAKFDARAILPRFGRGNPTRTAAIRHNTHRECAGFLVAVKFFSTLREQQSLQERIGMRCAKGRHLSYVPRTAHVDLRRLPVAAAELHLDEGAARERGRTTLCALFSLSNEASSLARADKGGVVKRVDHDTRMHQSVSTTVALHIRISS